MPIQRFVVRLRIAGRSIFEDSRIPTPNLRGSFPTQKACNNEVVTMFGRYYDLHMRRFRCPALLTIMVLCSAFGIIQAEKLTKNQQLKRQLANFQTEEGIVYKTVAGKNLKLTLFLPKKSGDTPRPWMLYTHGGGWSGGTPLNILKGAFQGTLSELLDAGVVCATIEYRLSKGENTAVQSVEDCQDAARFLIKNAAKWNLNSKRLGVWGGSAGGHLSLMTALADDKAFVGEQSLREIVPRFRCVVSYYPLTSFERMDLLKGTNFESPEKFIPILGGLAKDKPEVASMLSPVNYIKSSMPPILLIHGKKDTVLPLSQSELFLDLSQKAKARTQLLSVKGAGHSLSGKKISPSLEDVNKRAAEFVLKNLGE